MAGLLGLFGRDDSGARKRKNEKRKKCRNCGSCRRCKKGKCKPKADGTECGTGMRYERGSCQAIPPCEGVDLQTDVNNCGVCGHVCEFENAVPLCNQGECQIADCHTGFANCDFGAGNGCETPLGTSSACRTCTEICNSEQSCDLKQGCVCPQDRPVPCGDLCITEGVACSTGHLGVCSTGTTLCVSEELRCIQDNEPGPLVEVCDGLDNDCDGLIDEGFGVGEQCEGSDEGGDFTGTTQCTPTGQAACVRGSP